MDTPALYFLVPLKAEFLSFLVFSGSNNSASWLLDTLLCLPGVGTTTQVSGFSLFHRRVWFWSQDHHRHHDPPTTPRELHSLDLNLGAALMSTHKELAAAWSLALWVMGVACRLSWTSSSEIFPEAHSLFNPLWYSYQRTSWHKEPLPWSLAPPPQLQRLHLSTVGAVGDKWVFQQCATQLGCLDTQHSPLLLMERSLPVSSAPCCVTLGGQVTKFWQNSSRFLKCIQIYNFSNSMLESSPSWRLEFYKVSCLRVLACWRSPNFPWEELEAVSPTPAGSTDYIEPVDSTVCTKYPVCLLPDAIRFLPSPFAFGAGCHNWKVALLFVDGCLISCFKKDKNEGNLIPLYCWCHSLFSVFLTRIFPLWDSACFIYIFVFIKDWIFIFIV